MNAYEAKQEARRERLEAAADRASRKAAAAFDRADLREEKSGIPFGQPILVGHHSEGRHRAAIKRADNAIRAGVEASKRAADLAARAEAVGSGGISSDDPDAVVKLADKLDKLEGLAVFMREANKVVRAALKAGIDGSADSEALAPWISKATEAGNYPMSEGAFRNLLSPQFGPAGFPGFCMSNNNAEINRLKKRIAQLRGAAKREHQEVAFTGGKLVQNVEENRIQIVFDGAPSANVRQILKGRGFRWSPSNGAWQRMLNNAGVYAAKEAAKAIAAMTE